MDINLLFILLPLILGWIADKLFGDPHFLPHPVVGLGKLIAWGEKVLNKGNGRVFKGAIFAITLICASFLLMYFLLKIISLYPLLSVLFSAVIIFFCLAGKTLIDEVRQVFYAVDSSIDEGPHCRTGYFRIVSAANPDGCIGNLIREPE